VDGFGQDEACDERDEGMNRAGIAGGILV